MSPDSPAPDQHTLGLVLAGTGLLFMVEPAIALVSATTYRAINNARRQNRISILWPAGLVVLTWGLVCLSVSIPPRHVAQWCLLLLALPCVAKGLATLLFSAHLAKLSEKVHAQHRVRRFRYVGGLMFGGALVGWGLFLFLTALGGTRSLMIS